MLFNQNNNAFKDPTTITIDEDGFKFKNQATTIIKLKQQSNPKTVDQSSAIVALVESVFY